MAQVAEPDLILQAMRAGANEFFTWPPAEDTFHSAIRRTAARRETTQGAPPSATTLVFFGAKGGAGTTTIAVNCGVELARLTKRSTVIVDLKPGLGEVALFLGVRPRYSIIDAIDNLHRLDREFLRELVLKHKSGLEILAGSDHFDRPGGPDAGAIEELLRLLGRQYEYILIDAGSQINACSVAALYAADQMFLIANPDVPSVRNAQRLLDRVRQLGACRRARALRAQPGPGAVSDSAQADRGRARPSDSPHVPERLQDRVDGAQFRRAAGAGRKHRHRRAVRFVHPPDHRSGRRYRSAGARQAHQARSRAHRVPLVKTYELSRRPQHPRRSAPSRARRARRGRLPRRGSSIRN